jgi:hypothetical protein
MEMTKTNTVKFNDEVEFAQYMSRAKTEGYARWLFYTCDEEERRIIAFFKAQMAGISLALASEVLRWNLEIKKWEIHCTRLADMCGLKKNNAGQKLDSLYRKGALLVRDVAHEQDPVWVNDIVANTFREMERGNR